jgi:hypothetical protein
VSGLALDPSTPAVVAQNTGTTLTVTTASFTPPSGSLLVPMWAANGSTTDPTQPAITDSLGSHLVYSLLQWRHFSETPASHAQAAAWRATGTNQAMTVTVTTGAPSPQGHTGLYVPVLTGYDQATPIGPNGEGSSLTSSSTLAVTYAATRSGGWGFLVVADWNATGSMAAGAGTTLIGTGTLGASDLSYGFFRRTVPDDVAGANTTLNVNFAAASADYCWAYVSINPALGGAQTGRSFHPGRGPSQARFYKTPGATDVPEAAPATAPAFPFSVNDQPRRVRGLELRRGRLAEAPRVVAAPAAPAAIPGVTQRPPVLAVTTSAQRRRRSASIDPPFLDQDEALPVVLRVRLRKPAPVPRRAVVNDQPLPADQPTPEAVDRRGGPGRQAWLRRARRTETVPPQFNPPYVWHVERQPRTLHGAPVRRGHQPQVTPPQFNPPFPFTVARAAVRLRGFGWRRTRRPTETVPPQFNPPFPWAVLRRISLRPASAPRPRAKAPIAVGDVAPPTLPRRRTTAAAWRRARRPVEVTVTQTAASAPVLVPRVTRAVVRLAFRRRRRPVETVPAQVVVTPPAYVPQDMRIRVRLAAQRRGRVVQPPWPQIAVTPQAVYVPFVVAARRARLAASRKARPVPPPLGQDGVPSGPVQRRRVVGIVRRRPTRTPILPGPDTIPDVRRRGRLLVQPRRGGPTEPVFPFIPPPPSIWRPPNHRIRVRLGASARPGALIQPAWPQALEPGVGRGPVDVHPVSGGPVLLESTPPTVTGAGSTVTVHPAGTGAVSTTNRSGVTER